MKRLVLIVGLVLGILGVGESAQYLWAGPNEDLMNSSYVHRIQNRFKTIGEYPPEAFARGTTGRALVTFTINEDGTLAGADLTQSSGSAALDAESLRIVRVAAPYIPLPGSFHKKRLTLTWAFNYHDGKFLVGYVSTTPNRLEEHHAHSDPDSDINLFKAIISGSDERISISLRNGANVNASLKSSKRLSWEFGDKLILIKGIGVTPLIVASLMGADHVVKHLLSQGADPNRGCKNCLFFEKSGRYYSFSFDGNGVTPLMFASMMGHAWVVRILLDHNVNINENALRATVLEKRLINPKSKFSRTRNQHSEPLKLFFKDVNCNALCFAVNLNHTDVASILLNKGATIQLEDYLHSPEMENIFEPYARKGNPVAQFNLGSYFYALFSNGKSSSIKDYYFEKAVFWYKKAAEQGIPSAKINLLALEKRNGKFQNQTLTDLDHQKPMESLTSRSSANPNSSPNLSSPSSPGITQAELQNAIDQALKKFISRQSPTSSPVYSSSVDRPSYHVSRHSKDFALVIGVEKYPSPIHAATFADRDTQSMFAHLRALGVPLRHIKRLTDETATGNRIKGALHWLKRNVRSGSTVYVYFSGHGAPGRSGHAYLVPFDGDPNDLSDTGVSTSAFYRDLEHLPVRHIIVALDACFTGEGKRSVLGKGIRPLVTKIKEGAVPSSGKLVVLTAARSDQESGILDSKGHGLFTYYLLKGLNGGAEHGGHVTVAGLYRYLKPKVESNANLDNRSQTPELEPRNAENGASVRLR